MTWDFYERLEFSHGQRERTDLETVKRLIPGCISVRKTGLEQDRAGIDYIATLRKGAEIFIDAKARDRRASRYWKHGEPELALETWSVRPNGKYQTPQDRAKTGWTLCEKKNVDMIYFSFDQADTNEVFLIAFQPLRIAFRHHLEMWRGKQPNPITGKWEGRYTCRPEDNGRYESEAVFVPVSEVWEAIRFVGSASLGGLFP